MNSASCPYSARKSKRLVSEWVALDTTRVGHECPAPRVSLPCPSTSVPFSFFCLGNLCPAPCPNKSFDGRRTFIYNRKLLREESLFSLIDFFEEKGKGFKNNDGTSIPKSTIYSIYFSGALKTSEG